ncbi:MAG: aminotransferase class V-fold PLP-dependent enzyme [Planctomycetes bacterium]|nr:aminotransferase class V-fold PLP-dependent enzyme [Planctomycetota bacterium]
MIYLDHAATSWPKPAQVLEAWSRYQRDVAGSPGRGSHRGAVEASQQVEIARREIVAFLGASDPSRLIFTPSCTHAINLALAGVLRRGDHVVATALDHNAVLRTLAELEARGEVSVTLVAPRSDGRIAVDDVVAAWQPQTRLVVASHASNALGSLIDAAALGELARSRNVLFLLDAAQTAGVVPIDAPRLNADLVAIPSHKGLLAPAGVGALWAAPGIELRPIHFGGTGGDSTSLRPNLLWPQSFEAGTGNPGGIVAMAEGVRFVAEEGVLRILQRERGLLQQLREGLSAIGGVRLFGPADPQQSVGVLSMALEGLDAAEVGAALDSAFEIRVRTGHLCAAQAAAAVGAPASGFVRFSVGFSTTTEEIDAAISAVREIAASM